MTEKVTMAHLAELAGVNVNTVGRYVKELNSLADDSTVLRSVIRDGQLPQP